MPTNILKIIHKLRDTRDGSMAINAINRLLKAAREQDENAANALVDYMQSGQLNQIRTYAAARVADEPEIFSTHNLPAIFRTGLQDDALIYWAIKGLVKVAGGAAYPDLCNLAVDENISLPERAHAIQQIARHSKQPFNRSLPKDPGHWPAEKLPIEELKLWQKQGYSPGSGAPRPIRDVALDAPKTSFEIAVKEFDEKLAVARAADPDDFTDPGNYLAPGEPASLAAVCNKWPLPFNYVEFLQKFTPTNMKCELKAVGMPANFSFYKVEELRDAQIAFDRNTITGERDADWPASFVVIADAWGDPFALDLEQSNGLDAPIYTAEHGQGIWEFRKFSKSLEALLKRLKVVS